MERRIGDHLTHQNRDRRMPLQNHDISKAKRIAQLANGYVATRERALDTQSENFKNIKNITEMTYRGQPFIYDLLSAVRGMHDILPTMQRLQQKGVLVGSQDATQLAVNNPITRKYRGISILDIENMQKDPNTERLKPEDIQKINRMFRSSGVFSFGSDVNHKITLEYFTYFATQAYVNPKTPVPASLHRLHENVCAYLDYYTDFFIDFNRDYENETIMQLMLIWGNPYLPEAVGTYIPAKLNITPSSAIKLYKQHELLSSALSARMVWKKLGNVFLPIFEQAYRKDALPQDLEKYQHYNEHTDAVAAKRMKSYIEGVSSIEDQLQRKDEVEQLNTLWKLHKGDVILDIMQARRKRIEYQLPENHPAERVTVVKNRNTFVFVLRFSDDIHHTLEIDQNGKLFGIPPQLTKAFPHVQDVIAYDILNPLLKKYKPKIQIQHVSETLPTASPGSLNGDLNGSESFIQEEDEHLIKPQKRKYFTPTVIFQTEPMPPASPQKPALERYVAYTEQEVKDLLGPNLSKQQAVVDSVIEAIRGFEHGNVPAIMVKKYHGSVVRVRAGKYRIFFNRLGKRRYSLKEIKNRKDAYN